MQDCPICLNPMAHNIGALPCGHVYHMECILEYMHSKCLAADIICPTCRHPFKYPVMLFLELQPNSFQGSHGIDKQKPGDLNYFDDFVANIQESNQLLRAEKWQAERLATMYRLQCQVLEEATIRLNRENEELKDSLKRRHRFDVSSERLLENIGDRLHTLIL